MKQRHKKFFGLLMMTAALACAIAPTRADDADDGVTPRQKALVGTDAPDFSLKDLDGSTVKLSELKGHVVIVDLWATWCVNCVLALPDMDKLYQAQSPNGLKLFAVNQMEDGDKVKGFLKKKGLTLPVLLDPDGVAAQLFVGETLPETIVIGKDGKIRQIFVATRKEQLEALVARELK